MIRSSLMVGNSPRHPVSRATKFASDPQSWLAGIQHAGTILMGQ
jgi:hypothetical protein